MNTAAGTKGSRRINEDPSRKLKLVSPSNQTSGRKKFRIGICESLLTPGPANPDKGSPIDDAHATRGTASDRPGTWIAIAAVGAVIGFIIGSRRK